MKKIFLFILAILLSLSLFAQIDLSNIKNEKEIEPVPYDSTFLTTNFFSQTEAQFIGLRGQKITVVRLSSYPNIIT